MIWFGLGLVVGFVVGILVGRANKKKVEYALDEAKKHYMKLYKEVNK